MQLLRAVRRRLGAGGRHPALGLLLGAGLISALMLWPWPFSLGGQALDTGDSLQQARILRAIQESWVRPEVALFSTPTMFPARDSLAAYQPLYTAALLGLPGYLAGWSAIAVHNWLIWLSFALACWAMSLLALELTGRRLVSLAAGAGYAFASVRWGHLAHLNLLSGFWTPLILAGLVRLWRRPPLGWRQMALAAAGLGGLLAAQFLADIYNGLYLAAALALWCCWRLAHGRLADQRRALAALGLAALLAGLICAPFGLATWRAMAALRLERSWSDHSAYAATASDYLTRAFAGLADWPAPAAGASAAIPLGERTLWPGALLLGLGAVGLLAPPGAQPAAGRRHKGFWLLLLAVSWILSLGPTLRLASGGAGWPSPLYRLFAALMPLFSALRVASRWALLGQIGLAALAALGGAWLLERLRRWAGGSGGWRAALAPALGALLLAASLLDAWPGRLPRATAVVGEPVPAAYAELAGLPPGGLLEWPLANADPTLTHRYVYATLFHSHPIVNAIASVTPPRYAELAAELRSFPSLPAIQLLRGMGVRYVLIHRWELSGWEALAAKLAALPALRLIGSYDDGRHVLLALDDPPAAPPQLSADLLASAGGPEILLHADQPIWLDPAANVYDPPRPLALELERDGQPLTVTVEAPPVLLPGSYRWRLPDAAAGGQARRLGAVQVAALPDPLAYAPKLAAGTQLVAAPLPASARAGALLPVHLYGRLPVAAPGAVVGLCLMTDAGEIVAKTDLAGPALTPPERWPGDRFAALAGNLPIPPTLAPGTYFVGVTIWDPGAQAPLPFAGPDGTLVPQMWRLPEGVAIGAAGAGAP